MGGVIASLLKAAGQLADPAVLRVLAKSLGVTIAVFALTGIALYYALRAGFAQYGLDEGGFASATAAVLIAGLGFWFLFRIVALAVLQFFADEVVAAVEQRHYPQAAQTARKLPFREDLANSAKGLARALIYNLVALPFAAMLAFTAIGPALVFLAVNAVLLGRELTDMAWLRHRPLDNADTPAKKSDRFALGAVVAGMMLIPGIGLLAPVIGAAAGTHVAHRAMRGQGTVSGVETDAQG